MIAHTDLQVQQPEVVAVAVVEIHGGIDLVVVRHDIDAVAFLIRDQCVERDVVRRLNSAERKVAHHRRPCLEGESVGSPDGSEISVHFVLCFFLSTAAHAGRSETYHCNHKGTDEGLPHQFPKSYGIWCKHLRTNIV